MKKITFLTALAMTLFSVAASAQTYGGPYYGKGKARRRHRLLPKVEANDWRGSAMCRSFIFLKPPLRNYSAGSVLFDVEIASWSDGS
jgi:hypothetical protein